MCNILVETASSGVRREMGVEQAGNGEQPHTAQLQPALMAFSDVRNNVPRELEAFG